MRKLYIILICCLTACGLRSVEEKKAEDLVKMQLRSFNNNSDNYNIIEFKSLHPNFTTFEDDINYDKYKNAPVKLDSIKKNYKPYIRGWVIYVKFKGYDEYGKYGTHTYQCAIDNKLSKLITLIEVDGAPI